MNVLILGATGMVGQGVLRECLLDEGVTRVVTLGRSPTGQSHPKLREIVHGELLNLRPIEGQLTGLGACFYCLGASATGLSEADYTQINYVLTLSVAETLARIDQDMTFIYVSGAGTDSSERGRSMWARVKGSTENALLRLPFKAAVMFRPAVIVPMHGIKSRTALYRVLYSVLRPLLPVVNAVAPKYVTTTEQLGRAMLEVAKRGAPKAVLESSDINSIRTR